MRRGTGGNQFMDANAGIPELMKLIFEGLHKLAEYDEERPLDLGEVSIDTKRIPSGDISVTVMADLKPRKE